MGLELEAARQHLSERLAYWQGEVDAVVGAGVQLEVDPIGLPREKKRLDQFATSALGAVRSALSDAARDPKFAEYFRSRVAKILVRNDDAAPTSRFDFDVGRRLLVIISTSELKHWVDFLALKEFLAKEL